MSVDLSYRRCDGHVVVALRGELDVLDAAGVAAALSAVMAGEPEIVVDLVALEFIDCAALGALLRVQEQARRAGDGLRLAAPQRQVLRILTLTGLGDVFSVHASVDEAADGAGRSRRTAASSQVSRPARRDMIPGQCPVTREVPDHRTASVTSDLGPLRTSRPDQPRQATSPS